MNNSKKIFISGGSGFIGKNLPELLGSKYEFVAPGHQELDLLSSEAVKDFLSRHKFDFVIHLASIGGKRDKQDSEEVFMANKSAFFNVAENNHLFGRMIFFGSGAEYGKHRSIVNAKESDFGKILPQDEYGRAKYAASEYIAKSQNLLNLRCFGIFGKYEAYGIRFIANNICRSLAGLPIIVRQNTKFDYVYVNDLARILEYFIEHEPKHKFYNVGTGRGVELLTLANLIKSATGNAQDIQIKQPGFGREYTCDNSLLLEELGNFTFTPYGQAINEMVKWYKANWPTIDQTKLRFDE